MLKVDIGTRPQTSSIPSKILREIDDILFEVNATITIVSVYCDRLYHCLFRLIVSLTQLILGLELNYIINTILIIMKHVSLTY